MHSNQPNPALPRRRTGDHPGRAAVLGLIAVVLLSACASGPTSPPVRMEYDAQADFSGYRTFTWVADNPLIVPDGGDPQISALARQHIVSAIEAELARKGYARTSPGKADFAVAYTVGTRERIDVDSYPLAYRGRWYWRPTYWDYDVRARTYQEGMLSIDIFDQETHRPVWHGFTSGRITSSDRRYPEAAIREAVSAILSRFPPN